MLTSVMCVENIYPATMMNRSSLSAIVALCLNETPFLIKTAVPLALDESEKTDLSTLGMRVIFKVCFL